MTAACPGTVPTVLNGQVTTATASNNVFKEFECLTGFYMTGSKTITCTGSVTAVWTTAPTCNVITDNDEVFPEWWLIAAAVILALAVLACFLCILCYYCCGRGRHIHPYDQAEGGGGCCRDGCGCGSGCCRGGCGCGGGCCGASAGCCLMSGGSRCCPCCCRGGGATKGRGKQVANGGENGVYYVSTPPQGTRYYFISHGRATGMRMDQGTSTDGHTGITPLMSSSQAGTSPTSTNTTITGINFQSSDSGKQWKDYSNHRKRQDGSESGDAAKQKKAKEVRGWMPHSHPVRPFNTSTK